VVAEEADNIPENTNTKFFFLNNQASIFIRNYIRCSKMVTGPLWKLFNERYFKIIDKFPVTEDCAKEIKKWLPSKSMPFDKFVYINSERSG